MDCHIHSNWGIESIAQQIEAATKGEREDQPQPRSSLCKRPFLWLRPREIPLFSRLLVYCIYYQSYHVHRRKAPLRSVTRGPIGDIDYFASERSEQSLFRRLSDRGKIRLM